MRRSIITLCALVMGIFFSMAQESVNPAHDGGNVVYNTSNPIPDTMPSFQGSNDLVTFVMWVSQNVKYPEAARESGVSGRVIVQFVVDAEGYIAADSIECLKGDETLFAEVARVLAESPQWQPGAHEGRCVPVQFTIPVVFTL